MDAQTRSEELTVQRFYARQDRVVRDFGHGDTVGALSIAKANLKKLSSDVAEKINEAKNLREDAAEKNFCRLIQNLDPDLVALTALSSCLHMVALDGHFTKTVMALGRAIAGECWAEGLLVSNRKLANGIKKAVKERHGNLKYRKQAARSIASRAGYKQKHWSNPMLAEAGGWLLTRVLETLPDVFYLAEEIDGAKYLTITSEALAAAEAAVELDIQRHPVFLPTTEAPKPWVGWNNGGYWDERARLRAAAVRTVYKETAADVRNAMKDGTIAPLINALNSMQSVAWKINTRILDVINECDERGIPVSGVPPREDVPLPMRLRAWEDMSDDEKTVWKKEAAQVKQHNRTLNGNRIMFKQDCEVAKSLREAERFFTPMNCDWRGRVYGVPHFNFQRDDRVRALFLFADGEPLGEDGLRWLKIHTANCGDFDKVSKKPMDERVAWVDANLERIVECTNHPLAQSSVSFWTEADKPFLFLASCMELVEAVKSPSPTNFTTHLPVSFDGSCSGLQHLAAMTRDEATARLVNLLPGDKPQDVYQTVADAVTKVVQREALEGRLVTEGVGKTRKEVLVKDELPRLCLDFGITRKVVKRNVMTYSYSSKKYGMAKQLDEDLIDPLTFAVLKREIAEQPFREFAIKPHPHATSPAAKYLAEKIYAAIQAIVDLPEQAMVQLQKTARALAHESKPVTWTTPTGLPWANRYYVPIVKRIELWMHDTRVQINVADGAEKTIDKDKAANGVAPNFVHALDAAHLAFTANAAVAEGIVALATVHDSFGCLASRATRFNQIIREQFVKLYTDHDVLAEVSEQAKRNLNVHNSQRLPEGMQYGSFDLSSVLRAQYAFA